MRFSRNAFVLATAFSAITASLAGCGGAGLMNPAGSVDAGVDASRGPTSVLPDLGDNGAPSSVYPAFQLDPPQVATAGGAVLVSPKIVPVFFSNFDPMMQAQLTDFLDRIGSTNYWKAATQEYDGIGPATATKPVVLTEAAPAMITDAQIQTWIAGKLNANDPAFPTPDANTVYVLHYPTTTTITLQGGRGNMQSCVDIGGYHADVSLDASHGGIPVAYAVIPSCTSFGSLMGVDSITASESHELVESATDPHPMADPAYSRVDNDHFYWQSVLGGGEVGDMCAQFQSSFTKFAELPYVVQRTWSNQAAMAGHDPCVPALQGEVYFNAQPVYTDQVTISAFGQSLMLPGVLVPVGQSKTIDLELFSDGDVGQPWVVTAKDTASLFGGTPVLSFSLDRSTGRNGEKLHLTITSVAQSRRHSVTYFIDSKIGAKSHTWIGVVAQQ